MPLLGLSLRIASGPDPKQLMPFTSLREESYSEFFFPADYSYKLRSQATHEDFMIFVREMKMDTHQSSQDYYRKINRGLVTEIFYSDGWINYKRTQT